MSFGLLRPASSPGLGRQPPHLRTEQQAITRGTAQSFGTAIDFDGTTFVSSLPGDGYGKVYVFTYGGATWYTSPLDEAFGERHTAVNANTYLTRDQAAVLTPADNLLDTQTSPTSGNNFGRAVRGQAARG